jgi:hypothetical protein
LNQTKKTPARAVGAALGAVLLAAAGLAHAGSLDVSVDAKKNSAGGGHAVFTGLKLTAGEAFTVEVDPTQTWSYFAGIDYASSNADGIEGALIDKTNVDGTTFSGTLGSLVGKIGSGDYFTIGTSFSGVANHNGQLKLFYWDSDKYNNFGTITASISAVPEPASVALMGLGLVALAARRRRQA